MVMFGDPIEELYNTLGGPGNIYGAFLQSSPGDL